MPAAEVELLEQTENERILRWRANELERAGYDPDSAVELAARTDVDLHLAVELLEQGCPHRTALRILLEEMGRRPLADRLAEQALVMAYSAGEQRELRRLDARLAELEAERARKRKRFLQTRAMRETLERMREQAREDYLRQVAKREQSEFDEQAHIAFARKAAPLAAAVLE